MENKITNAEALNIEIGEKTYLLCFPTRASVYEAENRGLSILGLSERPLITGKMLFYTGLLAKQPEITQEEAEKLLEQYILEGGDLGEINNFLLQQYTNFSQAPKAKKKKKAKIVKI